ncbi:TolC family protein [Thiohalobacter sp. IOR34]|uniref:TolC family protein n=1 Tax=Thiohalobacter sp. IOR34 TaxID=3057176 RepID=UPI0025B121B0|nr:TolC family protein [Thiohalobacter sp. IOR34]WJW74280.1 TolC family protein [Thiohalobacter sp. IOR34]
MSKCRPPVRRRQPVASGSARTRRPVRPAAGLLLAALALPLAAHAGLSLSRSEQLALETDVTTPRYQALARAREEQAVADSQLPDPRLKLGAMNLPTDSFSRSQEPMTQLQVGIQQAFPPGKTLKLRGQRGRVLAGAEQQRAEAMRRAVLRDVRESYLEVYYQVEAERIIEASRKLFAQLVEVTRSHYAAGRKNQQDVLRASVELSLLDDRLTRARSAEDKARAALARLIGQQAAYQALNRDFPALPVLPARAGLEAALESHPLLQAELGQVEAGQLAADLARERYKPGWMLDLTYGDRTGSNPSGGRRSDFLSAMVLVDLPLFTANRQDRLLATRQQELEAARLRRDDIYLQLRRRLDADHAEWLRLDERLKLYRSQILPEAEQNAAASLSAYQAGVTDFSGLMRARLTELDSRLTLLRLRVDRSKVQARLLYLAGEQ